MTLKYKISVSTCFLDNVCNSVDEMLGDDSLSQISEYGFSNIELAFLAVPVPWRDKSFIDLLKKRLERLELNVCSLHAPQDEPPFLSTTDPVQRKAAVANKIDFLHAIGCFAPEFIVFHPGPLAGHYNTLKKIRTDLRESLTELIDTASKYNIKLALETLAYIDYPEFLMDVIETLPQEHVGICMDIGHVNVARSRARRWGFDCPSFSGVIELFGERLLSVHAHDNTIVGEKDEHLIPGEGDVPWPELLAALDNIDFSGWFTLETACFDSPAATLKACRAWIDKNLSAC